MNESGETAKKQEKISSETIPSREAALRRAIFDAIVPKDGDVA